MKKSNFWKSYGFLILMLTGIVAGCVVGAIWPAVMEVVDGETIIVDKGATVLEPLGTVFLNLMFCIAVPTVFCSISSSIANMQSARRAGKIMGVTIATFLVTAAIAAVIMYVTVRLIPPVVGEYALVEGEVGGHAGRGRHDCQLLYEARFYRTVQPQGHSAAHRRGDPVRLRHPDGRRARRRRPRSCSRTSRTAS